MNKRQYKKKFKKDHFGLTPQQWKLIENISSLDFLVPAMEAAVKCMEIVAAAINKVIEQLNSMKEKST